jgi:hypothetical protein
MPFNFTRLKYAFLGLFLLGSAWSAYHQLYVIRPLKECERKGGWWDPDERVCGTPIDISMFTGRKRGEPRRAETAPPAASTAEAPAR